MHAYYRSQKIDYRYCSSDGKRKRYDKTKRGAYKYWELERCLDTPVCPIDQPTKDNLKFLIGLRHEIEHQMTNRIDDYLSAKFQACCINFNHYVIEFFGHEYGIEKHLSISLQFASVDEPQIKQLQEYTALPNNISSYVLNFEGSLPNEEFNDPRYSYRVLYIPKIVNKKGQADKVIEFLPADLPEAEGLNREYVLIKDREKPKYLAGDVVNRMQGKGYKKFKMHQHTLLWKSEDAKNPSKGFGTWVANKSWYWYEFWISRS